MAKKIVETNLAARKEYQKIIDEIGATSSYYQRDNKLIGFIFEEAPDSSIFKKQKDCGWYPKKNIKAGKELATRIEKIKTLNENEILKHLNISSDFFGINFGGVKYYIPLVTVIPEDTPTIFLNIPWADEDPQKLKKYKESKKNETNLRSSTLDHLLWEPLPGMHQVKEWEIKKCIDEYNEGLETANTACDSTSECSA